MTTHSSRTLYVGNLPGDTRKREVEDIFKKYGSIVGIDLKIPPRSPGYAFVEFEDYRDAEDAVYRDWYNFNGHRLRVEFARGGRSIDCYSGYGRGFSSSNSYSDGGRGTPKYTEYRVIVAGLPSSASWQDVKDHLCRAGAGDVNFSRVFRKRNGLLIPISIDLEGKLKDLEMSEDELEAAGARRGGIRDASLHLGEKLDESELLENLGDSHEVPNSPPMVSEWEEIITRHMEEWGMERVDDWASRTGRQLGRPEKNMLIGLLQVYPQADDAMLKSALYGWDARGEQEVIEAKKVLAGLEEALKVSQSTILMLKEALQVITAAKSWEHIQKGIAEMSRKIWSSLPPEEIKC